MGNDGISAFLIKSNIKFDSISTIKDEERNNLDKYISASTSYDSWHSLLTAAASDWVVQRINKELDGINVINYSVTINGTAHKQNSATLANTDQDRSQALPIEIESHVVAATLLDLPVWATEWAKRNKLSLRLLDWTASEVFEFREVWRQTYEKYPRYFPKELAKKPLWDVTEIVGNSLWYFDQKFYLHELSSQSLQILKAASGGITEESLRPTNDEDEWTAQDLWVFAKSLGLNLLVVGTATVVIAGIGAISAPIAITAAGALIIYGLSRAAVDRISQGQATVQIVGGTVSDSIGLSDIWELATDQDIATGNKLNLSRDERTQKLAGVAANVLVTPASPKLMSIGKKIGSKAQPRVSKLLADADQAIYTTARLTAAEIAKLPRLVRTQAGYLLRAAENTSGLSGSNSTLYVGFFVPLEVIYEFISMYNAARRGTLPSRDQIRSLAVNGDRDRAVSDSDLDLAEQVFKDALVAKDRLSEIEDLTLDDFEIDDDMVDVSELSEKSKRGGDNEAARFGIEVHKDEAELKHQQGGYSSINQTLKDDNGNDILVPIGGHAMPKGSRFKIGMKPIKPDAIDFKNRRVIDEKPNNSEIYYGQMSEYIAGYLKKYGELPVEVVLRRYDSKGKIIREDRYPPSRYGFYPL